MRYDKKSLQREYLRLAEKLGETYEDKPREGYVCSIQHLSIEVGENPAEVLKDCEFMDASINPPRKEKVIRDLDAITKKEHSFVYFDVLAMQHPESGMVGFVMVTKYGFVYDINVVNVLLNAKRWNAGEERNCCACYDINDDLVGVSICNDKDKYSKKEARYNAYNMGYRLDKQA